MARLPQSGGDAGNWGDILNDYLLQVHTDDGKLKDNTVGSPQILPSAITESKLDPNVRSKLNATQTGVAAGSITNLHISSSAAIEQTKIADLPASLASKANDSAVVHKTGDETITGIKNFTGTLTVSSSPVVTTNDNRLTNQRTPIDNSVSTAKVIDGAITTAKIADSSISQAKLQSVGQANGLASLDGNSKVNETQIPDRLSQAQLEALISSMTGSSNSPASGAIYTDAIATFRAGLSRRLSSSPVVIVFTGSSSTAGTGASVDTRRYVNRFMDHVRSIYPALNGTYTTTVQTLSQAVSAPPSGAGIFAVNAGIAGTRSDTYLTSTTRSQIGNLNPRAIIHMIGANDYGNGVAVSAYKANLISQINSLDALIGTRHTHIFIHSYPRFDSAALSARVAPWSDYLAALYQIQALYPDTVAVIDTNRDWSVAGVTGAASTDPMDLIGNDEIHMNDYGHEFLADLIRIKLLDAVTSGTVITAPVDTAPQISTTSLNTMTVNSSFSQTIAYTGSTSTFTVTSGAFPTGISMSGSGVISGTPTTAGSYTVTIQATNGVGSDDQLLTGSVLAASTAFTTVFASDSFDRADDVDITGSSTDSFVGGTAQTWQSSAAAWNIVSNALASATTAGGSFIPINTSDYEISAIIKTMTSATGTGIWTIDGRRSAVASSGASQYRLRYVANGTVYLSKYVSGTETVLWTSATGQVTVGDELGLRMDGTVISVRKNGADLQVISDSSITTSAFAGFSHVSNATGSWESMKITTK
ncbi:MAG: GDSL-type esterase/lipase family protein [Candidatus Microsaccharimonas sp.]